MIIKPTIWAMEERAYQAFDFNWFQDPRTVEAHKDQIAALHGDPRLEIHGNVAVVPVQGVMIKGIDFPGIARTDALERSVRLAASDRAVDTIALRIDSPGGSVDGIEGLVDAVAAAKTVKPVVAHVEGLAASAAFWVASQASKVFTAGKLDRVGSIGVINVSYDLSAQFEQAGIEPVVTTTGPFKATGTPGAPITDEQRADIQREVDAFFGEFVASVRTGRGLSGVRADAAADGRIFVTSEAVEMGLVDGVRSLSDTISRSKRAAKSKSVRSKMIGLALDNARV